MTDFAPFIFGLLLQRNGVAKQVDDTLECLKLFAVDIRKWRDGEADRVDLALPVAELQILLEQMRLVVGAELVDAIRAAKIEQIERSLQNGN